MKYYFSIELGLIEVASGVFPLFDTPEEAKAHYHISKRLELDNLITQHKKHIEKLEISRKELNKLFQTLENERPELYM